jgi:hypothetical protein
MSSSPADLKAFTAFAEFYPLSALQLCRRLGDYRKIWRGRIGL